jgi:hypothetical protein
MAALKLIEETVALCPGRYEIVPAGKEPRVPAPTQAGADAAMPVEPRCQTRKV